MIIFDRMKKIILLFLFIGLQGFAQKRINAPEIISSILKTPDGKIFRMYETRKDMASVFVFMLPIVLLVKTIPLP